MIALAGVVLLAAISVACGESSPTGAATVDSNAAASSDPVAAPSAVDAAQAPAGGASVTALTIADASYAKAIFNTDR